MEPSHKDQAPPGSLSNLAEGEEPGRADQAVSLPARVARYGRAKDRAASMGDYLSERDDDAAATKASSLLATCGNYLHFRHYWTTGDVRLHAARFCRQHLICPLCAIRRGSKTLDAYLQRFAVLQAERSELRPYLATFTVQNGDDLRERFLHLRESFRVMQQRRHRWLSGVRGAQWTEFAHVAGAVGSYEVTNRGRGWHPHLHAVVMCAQEPVQAALRAEWEAITGDSFMIDVRPFRDGQPAADGFMEVMKYAMKFGDLSLPDNWHAAQILRGYRLLFSLGCFRGVQVPEELIDEPLEGLPYFDLFYRYFRGLGYVMTGECPRPELELQGES